MKPSCLERYPENADSATPYAITAEDPLLWDPGQEIPYTFMPQSRMDKEPTRFQIDLVQRAMAEWMMWANIEFKHDPQKAVIRIAFRPGPSSLVGKQALDICSNPDDEPTGDISTCNVGIVVDPAATGNVSDMETQYGVVLHELGHVLGLRHEHASPAMAGQVDLKPDALIQAFDKMWGWDAETVRRQILRKYDKSEYSLYTRLDRRSIMMYALPAEAIEQGIDIEANNALSNMDRANIYMIYPPSGAKRRTEDVLHHMAILEINDPNHREMLLSSPNEIELRQNYQTIVEQVRAKRRADAESAGTIPPFQVPPLSVSDRGMLDRLEQFVKSLRREKYWSEMEMLMLENASARLSIIAG